MTKKKKRGTLRLTPNQKAASGGDCYEAAYGWLVAHGSQGGDDLRLVHAEVSGQGVLEGLTFGHAWVENLDTGWAFDPANGRLVAVPIAAYRRAARIVDGNVHEYTRRQAVAKLARHRNYGPWDLKTSSGL